MSKLDQFDLDQLLLNLHGELSQVLAGTVVGKTGQRLQLERLNFKMGQNLEDDQENSLDPDRYPNQENWKVELQYEPGLNSQESKHLPLSSSSLLVERIKDYPISTIKGINTYWAEKWESFGVKTIADLFNLNPQKMWDESKRPHSQLIQHHSLVQQLQMEFPPLSNSKLYVKPLSLFWSFSLKELMQSLNPLTQQQVITYQQLSWRLATVLDLNVVRVLTMDIWRPE